jgi:hypothetical protein
MKKLKKSVVYTVVGYWIVGLVTAFLLVGANVRSILWIFLLGAAMSYYTLTRGK